MGLHLKWEKNGPGKMLPTGLQYVPKEEKLGRCKKRSLSNRIHGLGVIPELCVPVSWVLNG